MIREDGIWTFYILKTRDGKGKYLNGDWYRISHDFFFMTCDEEKEFSASGECWQKLGIHGTFNKDVAQRYADKLKERYKQHEFAVFQVDMMQRQIQV